MAVEEKSSRSSARRNCRGVRFVVAEDSHGVPGSEPGRAGGSEDAPCYLAYRQMVFRAAGGQSDIHVMRPKLAHHLRSDISARDAFLGQIFELRSGLTQRRFRNN